MTLAFTAATFARLGTSDASVMLDYEQGLLKIFVVAVVFITCMYYFDLYDSLILRHRREFITRFVQVLGTVCVLLAVLYYAIPALQLGRGIFMIGLAIVALLLLTWRQLFLVVNALPELAERTLILGEGPLADPLIKELQSRTELGIRVAGHVKAIENDNGNDMHASGEDQVEKYLRLFESYHPDRIIVAFGDRRGKMPLEALLQVKSRGVKIQEIAEVYEAVTGKVPVEALQLSWLLFSRGFRISHFLLSSQRFVSLIVSIIGSIVALPLVPVIALAIRLTSPGPILYRQKRVGHGGKVFDCYKFRTMHVNAEADTGPTWARANDPRVTRVGRVLRHTRLDEIPQLWNVFKGDMNLVGPRPERPGFVQWLASEIPHYRLRHTVRPGLTGWAQIRYHYGSSLEDAREKLRFDLFYVKNMSAGLDLLILFETIKTLLLGRGAQ